MSERLFDYDRVELTGEPKLVVIPVGLDEHPHLEQLLKDFQEVSEEYFPVSEVIDYTTAEMLIPSITAYIEATDSDAAAEAEDLGVIITQVIQLTGNNPSVIVSVTFPVDVDMDDVDEDAEEEEDWD